MDYKIGSIIEQSPYGGGTRTVKVSERESINGRPGFVGTVEDGTEIWGYDYQITRVVWK